VVVSALRNSHGHRRRRARAIKPGRLARKRILVPLAGATFTRDAVRVDAVSGELLEESSGGTGLEEDDLNALGAHYGREPDYALADLESSLARRERLEAVRDAEARLQEAESEADRRRVDAEDAAQRLRAAEQAAEEAEERKRLAAARVERVRSRGPDA